MRQLIFFVILLSLACNQQEKTENSKTEDPSIDRIALNNIIKKAKETNSSALAIYVNNKLIVNQCYDPLYRPLNAQSATKSFTSLGIGLLITQGKLVSINEPVYKFYPEWNTDLKKQITIRHLLNHTSGIKALRRSTEVYASPDYVKFALQAEIAYKPGSYYFYNNTAVNLLAGIIEKASGQRMDHYIKEYIFDQLGIKDAYWITDAWTFHGGSDTSYLQKGNPIGMSELIIKADDLAKVGLLVMNKGNWKGKQIISPAWIDESMKPSQPFDPGYGLLWWLIYDPETSFVTFDDGNIMKLRNSGISDTVISDLLNVRGRYKNGNELYNKIDSLESIIKMGGRGKFRNMLYEYFFFDNIYTPDYSNSKIIGYEARGSGGQYIIVYPEKKIVAVRTKGRPGTDKDIFPNFYIMAYNIVK